MKVSIATYSYRGLLADGMVFRRLEAVRFRHGLPAIDIWNGFTPDELAFDPNLQAKARRALAEQDMKVLDLPVMVSDFDNPGWRGLTPQATAAPQHNTA